MKTRWATNYPIAQLLRDGWDRSHYGSWHLYGHSHGNLPPWNNSLDVGVNGWDYRPVSIEMVYRKIRNASRGSGPAA